MRKVQLHVVFHCTGPYDIQHHKSETAENANETVLSRFLLNDIFQIINHEPKK